MLSSHVDKLIRQWGERFRQDPLASRIVASLHNRSDEIWQRTFELLQRESPEYRNSIDDEFTKESKSHCNELLKTIIAVAAGLTDKAGTDPFNVVRTHAEWRARHQVPLIASLHAYRLAHRTYWTITRESLLPHSRHRETIRSLTTLSDFWIEFFDHVGAVLAESHAVEEGLIVAQSTRTYVGLIDDLLRGLQPRDADARRTCALCGIRAGAPMAVAIARPLTSGNDAPVDLEVTLRSLVRLVEQVLPSAIFGKLIDIRNGEVTVIACSDADTSRGLVEALGQNGFARRAANSLPSGVGISLDTIDIARLPDALDEARLALEFASTTEPLIHFSDIDLPELLIRRADRAAFRLIPEWASHFNPSNDDQSRELTRTVRVFAGCDFNVKQTARRLGVHVNTVYFRLNRIRKLTGVDPRTYAGVSGLLTVFRLLEVHRSSMKLSPNA
jgi:hypothetical protein